MDAELVFNFPTLTTCLIFERLIHHPRYVMTRDTHARAFGTYMPVALGIDERHRELEPVELLGMEDPQDESVRDTDQ